jgi:predicted nuclease of restriction endonuclease-like (RecB) superfamily
VSKCRRKSKTGKTSPSEVVPSNSVPREASFREVISLIHQAQQRAFEAVNTELIDLYWRVGEYICGKVATDGWGKSTVVDLAAFIRRDQPGARGFSAQNLWRMRQFYETYAAQPKLSALLRELSWTNNMLILGKTKRAEEREFYLRLAAREKLVSRDLERQLKSFLIELGRDFCFIGTECPLQVGRRNFSLDLLFFNRALNCLVAFELKTDQFQPEHLGKLEFYLEALDRDVKKPHERPSIGVLLCATKDSEVVEYALARSVSPALIAEYQTALPDKKLLQRKLHEFYQLTMPEPGVRSRKAPQGGRNP